MDDRDCDSARATTIAGLMSPWFLLVLTSAISAGDAFETPTWRAVLLELVPKDDLPAASALNGIEFNFARAVGPALAGALISTAGVGTTFVVNAISFAGVFLVPHRSGARARWGLRSCSHLNEESAPGAVPRRVQELVRVPACRHEALGVPSTRWNASASAAPDSARICSPAR